MKLKITQIKSAVGNIPAARRTLETLGLRGVGKEVIREDRPEVRGMVRSIRHLVTVEEVK